METAPAEHTTPQHQDQLLIIEEVAEQMRTTPSTIRYKLQVDPNFPRGFKLGVRRLWRQSALDQYIRQAEEDAA